MAKVVVDAPAAYPGYGEGYHAVFFLDPDGLKLEAMHVQAALARLRALSASDPDLRSLLDDKRFFGLEAKRRSLLPDRTQLLEPAFRFAAGRCLPDACMDARSRHICVQAAGQRYAQATKSLTGAIRASKPAAMLIVNR